MLLNKETIELQNQLAMYCRTGQYEPINGVKEDRVKHYRRLVFNNVQGTLKQAYPITYEWLSDEEWDKLVSAYFTEHPSVSPKIWEMPKEFMEFVNNEGWTVKLNKPALNDLLLFEWIEIEVHTMPDVMAGSFKTQGNPDIDGIVLNPNYRLERLEYPVHILNANVATVKKGNWFVYIFRDIETGEVQFMDISALHVFMLEKLYEEPCSLLEIVPHASSIFEIRDMDLIMNHLRQFVNDLQQKGAILGFKENKGIRY